MQIFELHFNPKLKEEQVFDSFVYEPENIYEKKLGSLYMVGELHNTLPQNLKFLNNLAKVIKKNYYTLSFKSPEKALSQSSKKANEFLAEEVKNENVSWLGNLNFTILSLDGFNLTFTKTGELKILLLRGGEIIDIGKNLDLREIEPYPLKIFLSIASGKLSPNDLILVLTKDIFEFFQQQNLLAKIAQASSQDEIDSKKLKNILPSSLFTQGEGSKISGICFLSVVKAESEPARQFKPILFQKEALPNFSLKNLGGLIKAIVNVRKKVSFKISLPKLPKPRTFLKKVRGKLKIPKLKIPNLKALTKDKLKIPTRVPISIVEKFRATPGAESIPWVKKLILILALILSLSLGFLIFKQVEEKKENEIKFSLSEIQEKVNQAENFLIFKNEEKANSLFKEAWREILPLTEIETSIKSDVISLKQSIEENLNNLNKLETIENPEIVAEPNPNLFSSPSNSLVEPPPFDFNFDLSASYLSNLYFLDKKTCEIIKYPYLSKSKWGAPKKWMEDKGPCSEPKSMTIDGSVWILNQDNSISRYHQGSYQETITFDFFPFPENITKIKTSNNLAYFYLLEPAKKRIIITDKTGKIIKQFQSEKFDNLKDFDVSETGKTIWLLNDSEVYKVEM